MITRLGLTAAVSLLTLAACGPSPSGTASRAAPLPDHCVPIAEGTYEFRDGRFLAVSESPERLAADSAVWSREIERGLGAAGLNWLVITIQDQVAVVSGVAVDIEARDYGFKAGKAAIEGHPKAGPANLLIVDAVSVEDAPPAAGLALAELAGEPISREACQTAFDAIARGQTIQFESGNARISPVSANLLDAFAGTALLCRAFAIEIGSHTDARGSDDYNQRISQERAEAVRNWLVGKGVAEETLTAVGYGESRLLDPAGNAEAHAINRRTEFKVSER